MRRRTVLAVLGWLVAAVVATLTGLAAVNVIGDGITGPSGEVLSEARVAAELASPEPGSPDPAPPGPAAAPSPTPSPGSSPDTPSEPATPGTSPGAGPTGTPEPGPPSEPGQARALATPGGTVVARCDAAGATLVSWAPAQGFGVAESEVDRGPDDEAELTFHGTRGSVEVEVTCAGGQPTAAWKWDDD